jgi:hypothetical protein
MTDPEWPRFELKDCVETEVFDPDEWGGSGMLCPRCDAEVKPGSMITMIPVSHPFGRELKTFLDSDSDGGRSELNPLTDRVAVCRPCWDEWRRGHGRKGVMA